MSLQPPPPCFVYASALPQILVKEISKPWYHFLTTTCAIIGGVFTVAGILDAILYTSIKMVKKVRANNANLLLSVRRMCCSTYIR
jgi:hypothetical protein